ncbi:hypothetical protein [Sodalis-like endosymbiont of Proechinophthirus fluctus]|uniref:hypothetical protein n=1 Tax=Sodalis-like endosymbiont of Proechinophthirus fluctus TaxID=1462730 RepID=UPI000AD00B57|nr:hypothetical protein [Sodalis-like endosymbiont of Proechinophthirus fluctus]
MFFEYDSNETDWLAKQDKCMAQAMVYLSIIRRRMTPDLFTALVRNTFDRQVSAKAG